jgi:hypothetical protein
MARTHRTMTRTLTPLAGLALLSALAASTAHAQRDSLFTMRGVVRTAEGVPIDEALLTLAQDTGEVAQVRTLRSGAYTIPRLTAGAYSLSVRRIGFETRHLPVRIESERVLTFDVSLVALPITLEAARLDAGWTGVIGVVGNYTNMEPVDQVRLMPLAGTDTIRSDANGRFVLPLPDGGTGALRVERQGYAPRLVSYHVRPGERVELAVLVDSGPSTPTNSWAWKDLAQRHKWSTPRSVRVARSELLATDAHNLLVALEQSATVQNSGLIFSRSACLFVNGQPRPGFPIDALATERVEYVEGYAARGDLSRSLQLRWPRNAECGAPGGNPAIRRAIETGQGVQFVAVWLR